MTDSQKPTDNQELTPQPCPVGGLRLSKSAISTFSRCPRLYQYQYIDNKTTAHTQDTLTRGIIFHEQLELYWAGKQPTCIDSDRFQSPEEAVFVKVMAESYFDYWPLDEIDVLSVEEKIEIPTALSTRVVIFDAIIHYRGRTLLVESKTTGQPVEDGSWYYNKLDLDLQTGYYVWAAREKGYDISGVLYDVTRVPKMTRGTIKRKKVPESLEQFEHRVRQEIFTNPTKYHNRQLIHPNVDDVMEQVDGWETIMFNARLNSNFPRADNHCFMYGKTCGFKPVCKGDTTLDNERLYKIRKP